MTHCNSKINTVTINGKDFVIRVLAMNDKVTLIATKELETTLNDLILDTRTQLINKEIYLGLKRKVIFKDMHEYLLINSTDEELLQIINNLDRTASTGVCFVLEGVDKMFDSLDELILTELSLSCINKGVPIQDVSIVDKILIDVYKANIINCLYNSKSRTIPFKDKALTISLKRTIA